MSYLTSIELQNQFDLPISIPSVDLYPGDWIVVGTYNINTGQQFILRSMLMHTARYYNDPYTGDGSEVDEAGNNVDCPEGCISEDLVKECLVTSDDTQDDSDITESTPLVYAGIFTDFNINQSPLAQIDKLASGNPIVQQEVQVAETERLLRTTTRGIVKREPRPKLITTTGTYYVVLGNNTDLHVEVLLNGQIRLVL